MSNREWNFNPESDRWQCIWQDKYGTQGTLSECLEMTDPYREHDRSSLHRSESELIDVLAKFGSASGFWWKIWFDDSEPETKGDKRRSISVDIHKGHAPDDDEPRALGRREDIDDENFYPVVD